MLGELCYGRKNRFISCNHREFNQHPEIVIMGVWLLTHIKEEHCLHLTYIVVCLQVI